MGRGKGLESQYFKKKVKTVIIPQCPKCKSFRTWSKGKCGYKDRERFECGDCRFTFYLSEDAIEVI